MDHLRKRLKKNFFSYWNNHQHLSQNLHPKLLTIDHVPDVLKEPFIYTGYRPTGKPWKYYIRSLFYIHNESGNVWTHVIGFLMVLAYFVFHLLRIDFHNEQAAWPFVCVSVCIQLKLLLSATAHLFHSKSRWHHYTFFMLDYMGVSLYGFACGLSAFYIIPDRTFHNTFHHSYLIVLILVAWFAFSSFCIASTWLAENNTQRKVLMVVGMTCQCLLSACPTLFRQVRCLLDPSCNISSLHHVNIYFVVLILCAITFACHFPESAWPGSFDLLGHGHQIFHVLSTLTGLLHVRCLYIEICVLHTTKQFDLHVDGTLLLGLATVVVLQITTYIYFVTSIVSRRLSTTIQRHDVIKHPKTEKIAKDKSLSGVQSTSNVHPDTNGNFQKQPDRLSKTESYDKKSK